MSPFPGPVSKPIVCFFELVAGNKVMLAMPPIFIMALFLVGWLNSSLWYAGTSGAPWPPATISRLLKSATVVIPVRSVIIFASPS